MRISKKLPLLTTASLASLTTGVTASADVLDETVSNLEKDGFVVKDLGTKETEVATYEELEAKKNQEAERVKTLARDLETKARDYKAQERAYSQVTNNYQEEKTRVEATNKEAIANYEAERTRIEAENKKREEENKAVIARIEAENKATKDKYEADNTAVAHERHRLAAEYQAEQSRVNAANADAIAETTAANRALEADYQTRLGDYNRELKRVEDSNRALKEAWEAENKAKEDEWAAKNAGKQEEYDKKMAEIQKHIDNKEEGYMARAVAQNLIYRSEPNVSRVTIDGAYKYIDPTVVRDIGYSFGSYDPQDYISRNGFTSSLQKAARDTDQTADADDGKKSWQRPAYWILAETNKPVTITYEGLTNTRFNGKKISKLTYTITPRVTEGNSQYSVFQIMDDPTLGFKYGSAAGDIVAKAVSGESTGSYPLTKLTDFDVAFYYEDGSQVDFSSGSAIVSAGSRNSQNGEGEFFRLLDANAEIIPVFGGSIGLAPDGKTLVALGEQKQEVNGVRWDQADSPYRWYGGAVVEIKGGSNLKFQTGSSSIGLQEWFTFNADTLVAYDVPEKPEIDPKPQPSLPPTYEEPPVKPNRPELKTPKLLPDPEKPDYPDFPVAPTPKPIPEAAKPDPLPERPSLEDLPSKPGITPPQKPSFEIERNTYVLKARSGNGHAFTVKKLDQGVKAASGNSLTVRLLKALKKD